MRKVNTGVDHPFFHVNLFRSLGLTSSFALSEFYIGTPKKYFALKVSIQRRLQLGTAHKLKTTVILILTRVMCLFMKGLLATITNDQREI